MMLVHDIDANSRLYRVECWQSAIDGKYGRHHHIGIVCGSVVEAMKMVQEKYPAYRIDAVNQCGAVHHVIADGVP